MIVSILKWAVVTLVVWTTLKEMVSVLKGKTHTGEILGGMKFWHFLIAIPTLLIVVGSILFLMQVPYLDVGWWSLLGGEGNILFGNTGENKDTSTISWMVQLLIVMMLFLTLPSFAYYEEKAFRQGSEQYSFIGKTLNCIGFGLIHLIMGIPIYAAIALSAAGAVFMWIYLHGGMMESTRVHTAYNYIVVTLVGIGLLIGT